MIGIHDDGISILYSLVQQDEAAGITADQRNALIRLKHLAFSGNTDASLALSGSGSCRTSTRSSVKC